MAFPVWDAQSGELARLGGGAHLPGQFDQLVSVEAKAHVRPQLLDLPSRGEKLSSRIEQLPDCFTLPACCCGVLHVVLVVVSQVAALAHSLEV